MSRLRNSYRKEGGLMPGMLLLAHPSLADPNFRRTVILVSAYSPETGALGVVLNRPLEKNLGGVFNTLEDSGLADVPLYRGGPVDTNQLLLAGWRWDFGLEPRFKLHFGISAERAHALREGPNPFLLRAFLGYSGWSEGQLEAELEEGAWVCAPVQPRLEERDGTDLWKLLVGEIDPHLKILTEEPDDPSLN